MKWFKWFGAALATAAGVALIVATANAQNIVVLRQQPSVTLAGAAQTAVSGLVRACWGGVLADVWQVVIRRGSGDVDPNRWFIDVAGRKTLSANEAWAQLHDHGKPVKGGRISDDPVSCELTPDAQAAIGTLNAAAWSGNILMLMRLDIVRQRTNPAAGATLTATGLQTIDKTQADAALLAGEELMPVGVVR